MNAKLVAFAAALLAAKGALADFATVSSDIEQLQTAISNTNSAVESWDGTLAGALEVQNSEAAIESALTQAISDAQDLTIEEGDQASQATQYAGDLASSIQVLLNNLINVADQLTQLGANTIVANDLTKLGPDTFQFEQLIYDAAPCSIVDQLSGSFNTINKAFSDAASAYSVTLGGSVPTAPDCSDTSSAPASSAAASSAPASAASSHAASAASSAAVTKAPTNSTGNSTTVTGTAIVTVCTAEKCQHPSSTGVVTISENAGSAMTVGFGAAVAGAVALLL